MPPLASRSRTLWRTWRVNIKVPTPCPFWRLPYSTAGHAPLLEPIRVAGQIYPRDDFTNVPQSILSRLGADLTSHPHHPLGLLRKAIEAELPAFEPIDPPDPIVTPSQNFDELGFGPDHPGRSTTDSYYLNRYHMLRTHTSAHEVATFAQGKDAWLLTADVFRRDEIDGSHFPIFHQMEGARVMASDRIASLAAECETLESSLAASSIIVEDGSRVSDANAYQAAHAHLDAGLVVRHLKATLNKLIYGLFRRAPGSQASSESLRVRWIDASFPFTSPSYEVEVFYMGKWLELLGCGVVNQSTMQRAGQPQKAGWAFGLGLERIAMVLFRIPDIRLFWTTDARFLDQYKTGRIVPFVPFSKNPATYKDVSFWLPEAGFHENDFCEVVREAGGLLVEEVKLIDRFVHPRTQRESRCYRVTYRAMDRTLSNNDVNVLQTAVQSSLVDRMHVELR